MPQLHLLDATYELFRAYFGRPPRQTADGMEVGAAHGLAESVLSLLRQKGVTHLAAATDTIISSFRNDLYDGYKTGEGVEPDLLQQFPIAEEALESLGVTLWRMREFEADDGLATAALKYADDFDRIVILTPDKDLAQCVDGDHVVTFDRRKEAFVNEQGVWDKFGVPPESIPDYLALVGDSADGIPGIPGWGAKSTGLVLGRYRRIERIPVDSSEWEVKVRGAVRLAESLVENIDDALMFRTLTTLRRDVPLSETPEDLEWRGVPSDQFLALCDRLDFGSLRDRPHRWAD